MLIFPCQDTQMLFYGSVDLHSKQTNLRVVNHETGSENARKN